MRNILLFCVLLIACNKGNLHNERWQVIHVTSLVSGAFCLPNIPKYDTITVNWNIANPDHSYVVSGWNTKDSVVNGIYYYTYYVKQIL